MANSDVKRVLIKNGTLIDGTGSAPVKNSAILVEGKHIKSVGQEALQAEKSGAPISEVIDATGQFVLPGLIDGHVHLSMFQGTPPGIKFPTSAEHCMLRAAQHLAPIMRAGFTSVSVPGGKWFVDVSLREAVNAGMIEGPRIYCGGRGLSAYGGIFDLRTSWEDTVPDDHMGILCNSIEAFVQETRRQAKYGVDLIKLADSTWGDNQTISQAEIKAVVDEAHRRGVKVCIHSRGSGSTKDAAQAGVDWIFHADYATGDDLDAVAKAGMPIMPTFTQCEIWADKATTINDEMRDRLRWQLDINIKAMLAAKERGIQLLIGTDSGNAGVMTPGAYHGYEAAMFVHRLGFSPLEVIKMQTKDNAFVMGLAGKLGTIEAGMIADIIMLDADPIQKIEVIGDPKHVRGIIKEGRSIDMDRLGYSRLQLATAH